ncbi:dimethylsulfoniopropionate demethylase [Ruegeria sp. HKCCD8929]|uniref:dimethylsulfoniopropionate demethylase n=1 Tax=Ruegeria sp. HKCCD8929 TaxID=2683006 RepID=UPI0014898C48|nr:dimethylsulfoniopropionate demethylase [Ruegeria sp. HKCCD8929]
MAVISPNRRVRKTPFSVGVEAAGVGGYTVYNHMLLPTFFESVEADCAHLKRHVQVWDVSCERQVQIKGPDARRLLQILTPRDLARLSPDRCLYVPITDQGGGMINDPVALQAGPDTYWVSIADSDLLLWVLAIAGTGGFDAEVCEPDVSPLAVQGPKAEDLMARVFGDTVREIRFFGCKRLTFGGQNWIVARSGWSKQGGFEIYVEGSEHGMELWSALFAAGEDLNVRAGCPNNIERIESGLLSYGSDMTRDNTPLECGLDRYVSANQLGHCFGGRALREQIEAGGPERQIRPIVVEGEIGPCTGSWPLLSEGREVGQVASAAFSPEFGVNVAIGMVERSHWAPGTRIEIETEHGMRRAVVQERFWR